MLPSSAAEAAVEAARDEEVDSPWSTWNWWEEWEMKAQHYSSVCLSVCVCVQLTRMMDLHADQMSHRWEKGEREKKIFALALLLREQQLNICVPLLTRESLLTHLFTRSCSPNDADEQKVLLSLWMNTFFLHWASCTFSSSGFCVNLWLFSVHLAASRVASHQFKCCFEQSCFICPPGTVDRCTAGNSQFAWRI